MAKRIDVGTFVLIDKDNKIGALQSDLPPVGLVMELVDDSVFKSFRKWKVCPINMDNTMAVIKPISYEDAFDINETLIHPIYNYTNLEKTTHIVIRYPDGLPAISLDDLDILEEMAKIAVSLSLDNLLNKLKKLDIKLRFYNNLAWSSGTVDEICEESTDDR